jgi:hypothetical protein
MQQAAAARGVNAWHISLLLGASLGRKQGIGIHWDPARSRSIDASFPQRSCRVGKCGSKLFG